MICVSIGNISFEDCLKELKKNQLVEIRMDLLDYSPEQFKAIFSSKCKTVATCRPGEKFPTDDDRKDALTLAIKNGATYVDIEYEANSKYRNKLIEKANNKGCKVIISYHNYEDTPSEPELKAIVDDCINMGGEIAKLATMATCESDNTKILSLYNMDVKLVAFCMGQIGKLSRVMALTLGAEFTFASLNKEQATAPGQLTKKEIIKFLEFMQNI